MKNLITIVLIILTISISACYTSFTKIDFQDSGTTGSPASAFSFINILGLVSDIFATTLFFSDFSNRLFLSPARSSIYTSGYFYSDNSYYHPYSYGSSVIYVNNFYGYYPHSYWGAYYYPENRSATNFAARSFQKRKILGTKVKTRKNSPDQIKDINNNKERDKNSYASGDRIRKRQPISTGRIVTSKPGVESGGGFTKTKPLSQDNDQPVKQVATRSRQVDSNKSTGTSDNNKGAANTRRRK